MEAFVRITATVAAAGVNRLDLLVLVFDFRFVTNCRFCLGDTSHKKLKIE
jgi:hypothetical protein